MFMCFSRYLRKVKTSQSRIRANNFIKKNLRAIDQANLDFIALFLQGVMQQKKYKWGFSSPSTASLETVANMVDNKQVSQLNQNHSVRYLALSQVCQTLLHFLFLHFGSFPVSNSIFIDHICRSLYVLYPKGFSIQWPYFSLISRFRQRHASMRFFIYSLLIFPALFLFQIVPFIHKVFPFEETPAAFEMVKTGHLRGKVVIEVKPSKML